MKFINNSNDLSHFLDISVIKNIEIKNISLDSRTIKKDSLFIAINGKNFNGNEFIDDAFKNGACLAITDSKKFINSKNKKIIYVKNSTTALKKISKKILYEYHGNVIGITGSNGKTTTTKIITNALRASSSTLKNYNNELGMPLSIMSSNPNSKHLVIEMGAAKPGDISYLSSILKPHIGIITNIGNSHLKNLKNIKGVLKVKSELITNIKRNGILIVPNENKQHLKLWKNFRDDLEVVTFGMNKSADFFASNIKLNLNRMKFDICSKKNGLLETVNTSMVGEHNIKNILASFAASYYSNNSNKLFFKSINKNSTNNVRQNQSKWLRGSTLIDDTYNANPDSVAKAIDLLATSKRHKVLVLGDMLELGKYKKKYHVNIGLYAAKKKIDIFLGFGDLTKYAVKSFGKKGIFFDSEKELKIFLKENIGSKDIVLLKGSRGMKMEKFINV